MTLRAQVRKQFGSGFTLNADLTCAPGFHILFGASGAGKTTLLDCIAGLSSPDEGNTTLGERTLFDADSGVAIPTHLRQIGYVLQTQALFPHKTARENIAFGIRDGDRSLVNALSQQMGISDMLDRKPAQLSAGQRQRVALARTLVTEPQCVLMDEPLAALDATTKTTIIEVLRQWNEQRQVPILYVTHDRDEAYSLGERLIVMEEGKVTATGTPHEVLATPIRNTVAQLAGFENLLRCEIVSGHVDQGTMSCRIAGTEVLLEAPLTQMQSKTCTLGIRAGDILLAAERPTAISARNILQGRVESTEQRGVLVRLLLNVNGAKFEAHVTPGAQVALNLSGGRSVWLVIKTYSCHLLET
ncbi:Molybdate ABC transporter, ATPase subunit [Candidatus Koribacter versatilis Ellin345]|uniref:Molybdate ABC transporter, ATPase subunit n=1 Tax=Koribacter versatilis (strain Ellin345) TaxID=204669 RepID=Q1IQH1_KORVE|nr:ATP-binding cassette domain-containing protein [Candidatus Koribacter versatilis]ABF40879.1 Molybdate ABC transporter, ATPase subunit [Candidatus Koribacter versatilis Ellin345]